jgi:hypothetical protein
VDDVVVKTRNSDTLIADLEETFASLREYQWKLNPNKRERRERGKGWWGLKSDASGARERGKNFYKSEC